jgi:hypothetical protein
VRIGIPAAGTRGRDEMGHGHFGGAPLLGSKPCIPGFDSHATARMGWFEQRRGAAGALPPTVADGRFEPERA